MSFDAINKTIDATVGRYFTAFGLQTPELKPLGTNQAKTAPANPEPTVSIQSFTVPNSTPPSDSFSPPTSPVAKTVTEKTTPKSTSSKQTSHPVQKKASAQPSSTAKAHPSTHPSTHSSPHKQTRSFTASHKHPTTALNKLQQNKGGTPAWLEKYMAAPQKSARAGSKTAARPLHPHRDTHTHHRPIKMAHQHHTAENARLSKNAPVAKLDRAPKNQSQVASLFGPAHKKSALAATLASSRLLNQPRKTVPGNKGHGSVPVAHGGKPHGSQPVKPHSHRKS